MFVPICGLVARMEICIIMKKISNKQFMRRIIDNANKNALPVFGSFELTPFCNFDCKMCYIHLYDPKLSERMLSGKQWIRLMDEAIDRGMLSALLTGGEAMMHPDFWDIYMHLVNKGIQVRVKTNGLLLTRETIEKFTVLQPFMIEVSLYGCDDISYESVTGKRVFKEVIGNIRNAIANNLPLKLSIVPSRYMMPYLKDILTLAKSLEVPINVNKMLIEPNDNTNRTRDNFDISKDDIREIIRLSKEVLGQEQEESQDSEEEFIYNEADDALSLKKGLKCNAGTCTFAISWDGLMRPCLNFPEEIVSANLSEMGFERSWKYINEKVSGYTIPEECNSCEYSSKCRYCPREHGEHAKNNQCDAARCEAWKVYYSLEQNMESGK